jgi:hypothetical protein
MANESLSKLHVPDDVRAAIGVFVDACVEVCGDAFRGLAAYGSAVTGGYEPDRSDVNIALSAERFDLDLLEALRPAHRSAERDFGLALFLLTPEELDRAADAFPAQAPGHRARSRPARGRGSLRGLLHRPARRAARPRAARA